MKQSRWASVSDSESSEDQSVQRSKKRSKKKQKAEQLSVDPEVLDPKQQDEEHDQDERIEPDRSLPPPSMHKTEEAVISHQLRSSIFQGPLIRPCRTVDSYDKLNRIDEGSYGIVYRGKDKITGRIVALKKLKLENEKRGFPVTALREIHTLMVCKYPHVVDLLEVVMTPSKSSIFIVMEYLEHDLKTLMSQMTSPFLLSEIKTIMIQLLSAVSCMHQHWILHRDLKTSNLLINNRGQIKVADFGLARHIGDPPLGQITQLVVTLWYRSPELLLGETNYTSAVDMWSVGCIFGELVNNEPMFPGKGEFEQLTKILSTIGLPSQQSWPGFTSLPWAKSWNLNAVSKDPTKSFRSLFPYLPESGLDLLSKLLAMNPESRISAEDALQHPFFSESPLPKDPDLFPSFPSQSSGERVPRRRDSPAAPVAVHGGALDEEGQSQAFGIGAATANTGPGFRLKFA